MAIFNLEETPDAYITPRKYNDEFAYRMEAIDGEQTRRVICSIDLRSDKLMIYGKELKDSMLKKLYESLVFKPNGIICVNCNGACYVVIGLKVYKPIHDVIFDWSSFGVIVPNSIHDSLKNQVVEKERAVKILIQQLDLANIKVESMRASLKASNDEIDKNNKKTCEKIALIDFELELYKVELESCKKEEEQFVEDLCNCREERTIMEVELQKVRSQLSSANSELQLAKHSIHSTLENIRGLELKLSTITKVNQDTKTRLKMSESELSSTCSALSYTQDQFESVNKHVKDLEEQLSGTMTLLEHRDKKIVSLNQELVSAKATLKDLQDDLSTSKDENRNFEIELQRVNSEFCSVNYKLNSSKVELDCLRNSVKDLEHKLSYRNKENQEMERNFRTAQDELCLVYLQVQESNDRLESSKTEASGFKARLSTYENDCLGKLASLKEQIKGLMDQLSDSKKENEDLIEKHRSAQDEISRLVSKSIIKRVRKWFRSG